MGSHEGVNQGMIFKSQGMMAEKLSCVFLVKPCPEVVMAVFRAEFSVVFHCTWCCCEEVLTTRGSMSFLGVMELSYTAPFATKGTGTLTSPSLSEDLCQAV